MKSLSAIELQLSRLGIHNRFWGRSEIKELGGILADDEVITCAVNGRYEGGFCLLLTTDRRLLLIDKKVWFLNMQDVRFDMISEVDYCARLLDATLSVRTINKVLRFTSVRQNLLRQLTAYLQERLMELRQQSQLGAGIMGSAIQPQDNSALSSSSSLPATPVSNASSVVPAVYHNTLGLGRLAVSAHHPSTPFVHWRHY